jgi:hypothetical protein
MNKQKIKNAVKFGAAITLAAATGGAIVFVALRNKEPDWILCSLDPDGLQRMIDHPNSVAAFKDSHVLVGNSARTEII